MCYGLRLLFVLLSQAWADPIITLLSTKLLAQQIVDPLNVPGLDADVNFALSQLAPTCNFTDLNYENNDAAAWPSVNHTMRARSLATAVVSPASAFYQNTTTAAAALCALDWWLVHKPQSSNCAFNKALAHNSADLAGDRKT